MPTTTNFGWTTPADTDLVKDGASAIRTLGNGIDTSLLDLKGGTTGQILSKASNTDLDYTWINNDQGDITEVVAGTGLTGGGTSGSVTVSLSAPVSATNGGTAQTTYATGDLLYASATNTLAKRTIGSTGNVLTVSGGVPTWAAPATPSFVGCVVTATANQTIANSTYTALTWNSEDIDTNGFHDNVTNTSRFTIPSGYAGKYRLDCYFGFETNTTGGRRLELYVNGVATIKQYELPGLSTAATRQSMILSVVRTLAVGDYVEFFCWQSSGGNLTAYKTYQSEASVTFLGA
jgi:hypothetical protein